MPKYNRFGYFDEDNRSICEESKMSFSSVASLARKLLKLGQFHEYPHIVTLWNND